MAEQIKETHKYSKVFATVKLISMMFFGLILIILEMLYKPLLGVLINWDFPDVRSVHILTYLFIAVISTILHAILFNRHYDTLSTYCYLTKVLKTKVSFSDAAFLKKLFEPEYLKDKNWLSMQYIESIPEKHRRKAVMDAAKQQLSKDKQSEK